MPSQKVPPFPPPLFQLCSCISTSCGLEEEDPSTAAGAAYSASPRSSSLTYEWNTQLKHLVKCCRLAEARSLFNKMTHRDVVSWTTLVSGYVVSCDAMEALRLFSLVRVDPLVAVDSFLLSLVLKACGLARLRANGATLHAYSEKAGMAVASVFVGSALVDMYGKMGLLSFALQLFDEMPQRNVVSWTSMITALVHAGRCEEALRRFAEMWVSGIACDSHTLAIVLKACADDGLLSRGREIHAQATKTGFDATSFVANALASMYGKCGRMDRGLVLFGKMRSPDVVSWTAVIAAYLKEGRREDALRTFVAMMKTEGVLPNEYTYAAALSACAGLAEFGLGEQLHARTMRAGLARSASVSNAIITLYSGAGRLEEAAAVFQEMGSRDVVSWSAIVSGHAQEGHIEAAFRLLAAMRHSGTAPNEVTLGSLLSGCGSTAMLAQGRQLHAHAISVGLHADAMVRSSLIAMYSRCGSITDARGVFAGIPVGHVDVVSWTAMLSGYAEHGCGREAIELFECMRLAGLRPDGVTFVGVLSACCHEGLLDLGFEYFRSMREVHSIEPRREHYGCMVDLLCRAGLVEAAERLAETMPHEPDDVVWSMLLRACRVHGHADCGQRAAERILEAQPNCAGTHITLCNMYAAAGRWGDAADARKLMRSKGVKKEPGWSWITLGDGVSVFAAGDRMHRETERIYAMLELLAVKTKQADDDPEVSLMADEIAAFGGA